MIYQIKITAIATVLNLFSLLSVKYRDFGKLICHNYMALFQIIKSIL